MSRRRNQGNVFSLFAFQDIITSICGIVVLITLILALEMSIECASANMTETAHSEADYERMKSELNEMQSQIETIRADLDATVADASQAASLSSSDLTKKLNLLENEIAQNEEKTQDAEQALSGAQQRREEFLRVNEEAQNLAKEKETLQGRLSELQERQKVLADDSDLLYFDQSNKPSEAPWLIDIDEDKIRAIPAAKHLGTEEKVFNGTSAQKDFLSWAKTRSSVTEYFVLLIRPRGVTFSDEIQSELKEENFKWGIDFIGQEQKIEIVKEKE